MSTPVKFSALTVASSMNDVDVLAIVQSATSKQATRTVLLSNLSTISFATSITISRAAQTNGVSIGYNSSVAMGYTGFVFGDNSTCDANNAMVLGHNVDHATANSIGMGSPNIASAGTDIAIYGLNSTSDSRRISYLQASWIDAVEASRKGRLAQCVYETTNAQEGWRVDATTGGARMGIGGAVDSSTKLIVYPLAVGEKALVVKALTSQTGNLFELQNSSGTSQFAITSDYHLETIDDIVIGNGITFTAGTSRHSVVIGTDATGAVTGSSSSAIVIGDGASGTSGTNRNCVVIGRDATGYASDVVIGVVAQCPNSGTGGVAIGNSANSEGANGTAVGPGANGRCSYGFAASGNQVDSTAIGYLASANNWGATALGYEATSNYPSIVIGPKSTATAGGQLVIGESSYAINQIYIGEGVTSGSPQNVTYNATGGSGTDISAGDMIFASGRGTGTGTGGSIIFQTATAGSTGSSLNSLTTRLTIDETGQFLINNATASVKPLIIRGASSQSANLFEIQNSASTAQIYIDSNFDLTKEVLTHDCYGIKLDTNGVGYNHYLYHSDRGSSIYSYLYWQLASSAALQYYTHYGHQFKGSSSDTTYDFVNIVCPVNGKNLLKLETETTGANPTKIFLQERITTTDATVTSILDYTLDDNTNYKFKVELVGVCTGGTSGTLGEQASYERVVSYKRVSAGAATIVGSLSSPYTEEDDAAYDFTIDTSTNDVRFRVTGVADHDITWHLHLEIIKTPNS